MAFPTPKLANLSDARKCFLAFYLFWALALASDVVAQSSINTSEQSYQRARRVLEVGIEALPPAQDHPILLAERIKELGLDVQQIAGVHGRLRPISDLHKAIEMRKRRDAQDNAPAPTTSGTVREFCANIGPVSLTFDGATVTGRYRITVAPQPIDGTVRGNFKEGLLDAIWTDPEGTGRIIFGFTSDLSSFGAFFNSQKNPNHWFDGWKGVEAKKIGEVPAERRRSLRCDWK